MQVLVQGGDELLLLGCEPYSWLFQPSDEPAGTVAAASSRDTLPQAKPTQATATQRLTVATAANGECAPAAAPHLATATNLQCISRPTTGGHIVPLLPQTKLISGQGVPGAVTTEALLDKPEQVPFTYFFNRRVLGCTGKPINTICLSENVTTAGLQDSHHSVPLRTCVITTSCQATVLLRTVFAKASTKFVARSKLYVK